jgi:hypothetical protein
VDGLAGRSDDRRSDLRGGRGRTTTLAPDRHQLRDRAADAAARSGADRDAPFRAARVAVPLFLKPLQRGSSGRASALPICCSDALESAFTQVNPNSRTPGDERGYVFAKNIWGKK